MESNMKYDIFISYRRDGAESLAMLMYDRLSRAGYRVFLDVESLNSGKFNEALLERIRECTDMLVLLPPKGLDRCVNKDDWVRREIEFAIQLEKNIIPVMMRGFEFPKELPDSISALPKYNGVSATTMETFDGTLERLKKKFLHSKPAPSAAAAQADEKLMQMYHRFQFLACTPAGEWDYSIEKEADKLVGDMKKNYPARSEGYLCSLQQRYGLSSWKKLAESTEAYTETADWKYLLTIAPQELKEEMEAVAEASQNLRNRIAEEEEQARRQEQEKRRKEKERRREEEARRQEEQRRREEEEKQARLLAAQCVLDEADAALQQLLSSPSLPENAFYDGLLEVKKKLVSIEDILPCEELLARCNGRLTSIIQNAADRVCSAEEILRCYVMLCRNPEKRPKIDKHNAHIEISEKYIPAGIVDALGGQERGFLLADGSFVSAERKKEETDYPAENSDIVSMVQQVDRDFFLFPDGTVQVYSRNWEGSHVYTYDCSNVASLYAKQRERGVYAVKKDGTVEELTQTISFPHYVSDWEGIKLVYPLLADNMFGEEGMLIGIKRNGTTITSVKRLNKDDIKCENVNAAVCSWTECSCLADDEEQGVLAALRTDGTVYYYAQTGTIGGFRYEVIKNELCATGICCIQFNENDRTGTLFLQTIDGKLLACRKPEKSEDKLVFETVLEDVLAFDANCLSIDGGCALLADGGLAEFNTKTLKTSLFSCNFTKKAVEQGVSRWRRNAAEALLAKRQKEMKGLFMSASRKEKCARSIARLEEMLSRQD